MAVLSVGAFCEKAKITKNTKHVGTSEVLKKERVL